MKNGDNKMNNKIDNFKVAKLVGNKFLFPLKVTYEQNGKEKSWEVVKAHDSVAILLYHTEKKKFLLVKQFRAPVYLSDPSKTFTYELCAGIVDKNLSLKEIAKEEVYEECGYNIKEENIEKITSFYTNVGISGGVQTMFFSCINDDMKCSEGGGVDGEYIEIEFIDLNEFENLIYDESKAKTPGLLFSYYWFEKYKKELL